jgi:hypothetical protein
MQGNPASVAIVRTLAMLVVRPAWAITQCVTAAAPKAFEYSIGQVNRALQWEGFFDERVGFYQKRRF